MINLLLDPTLLPFSVALGLLFGLLALELLSALLGGSLLGMQGDGDLDLDVGGMDAIDGVDAVDGFDADLEMGLDMVDFDALPDTDVTTGSGDWLGIKRVPTLIWIAALLLGFGLTGVTLQTLALSTLGASLPALIATVPSAIIGVWFTRKFAGVFARILPKNESAALSENHLGRRRGVVSQGTAKRGKPAEVRVIDGHGNTHYLRAEPLRDEEEIPQGTPVLVMRKARDEGYRLVALPS